MGNWDVELDQNKDRVKTELDQARDILRNAAWLGTDEEREMIEKAVELLCGEPCDDAISRESLKSKLKEHHDFFVNAYGGFSNLPQNDKSRVDEINACIAMVVNEPSVTPKQRTGHWIYDRTRDWDGECKYECSECGMGSDVDYPYCMRCGAKMVEPQESEDKE